jgi:hypothetical protein
MPTAPEALAELAEVFRMFEEEYCEAGNPMPRGTTDVVPT